jgi:caffeoyl-CoA O-methyltransferase
MSQFRALDTAVAEYLEKLVPPRHPVLVKMEEHATATDFPIIGPVVGQLCYVIARAVGAQRVFELGSGFGYSTAWFARAVKENGGGEVHHVVWDERLSADARENLAALDLADVTRFTIGEAVETLRSATGEFDLIFNDIDKHAYPDALGVIEEKLRPGGVLIADNMLWHGRILDESDQSPDTGGIRAFTHRIMQSPSWRASVVPIRDGVLIGHWMPSDGAERAALDTAHRRRRG